MSENTSEERLEALKKQLEELRWPAAYMYKFICKNDANKIAQVKALFEDIVELTEKESTNRNYVSITAKEMALNPDSIIEKYKLAAKIDGIISL
jgi:hypothetical protein